MAEGLPFAPKATKRLVSEAIYGYQVDSWCTFARPIKKRRVSPSVITDEAPLGLDSREQIDFGDHVPYPPSEGISDFRRRKRKRDAPISTRRVSGEFADHLKQAADLDRGCRRLQADLQSHDEKYKRILASQSEDEGAVTRLREQGDRLQDLERGQSQLASMGYPNRQKQRLAKREETAAQLKVMERRRRRVFERLYEVAQAALDAAPSDDVPGSVTMSEECLGELQVLLDSRSYLLRRTQAFQDVCKELLEIRDEIREADAGNEREEKRRLIDDRRTTAAEYQQRKQELATQKELQSESESRVMRLARPYLAAAGVHKPARSISSAVSRGSQHVAVDGDALEAEFEGLPLSRTDLMEALENADIRVATCEDRFEKLSRRYHVDLDEAIRATNQDARDAFDKQYFLDRAGAIKELEIARTLRKGFRQKLKQTKLLTVSEISAGFETMSEDANTGTMGSRAMESWMIRRELGRGRVEQYCFLRLEAGPCLGAERAPTEPSNRWDGRSVALGDSECASNAGRGCRDGRRIRDWRRSMESMRDQPYYGTKDTGYVSRRGLETVAVVRQHPVPW